MESTQDDYAVISTEGGVPADVAHRLRPEEARLLAYVITHRDRAVSPQELALETLGRAMNAVREELERALFMVAITVAHHGQLRTVCTHFRGEFAFGIQWESSQRPDAGPPTGRADAAEGAPVNEGKPAPENDLIERSGPDVAPCAADVGPDPEAFRGCVARCTGRPARSPQPEDR